MSATLVIDTNLLVLFVVGTAGRALIEKHKRLNAFTERDYDELCGLIDHASDVLVTPNTLTETANLAAQIAEPARSTVLGVLQKVAHTANEHYIPSNLATDRSEYFRLGLTDAALIEATPGNAVLLTTDLPLYLAALNAERKAVNFNHLREAWL